MKRLLTLILAFAMLFTLFNAQSFAEEDAVVALEGTKFVTIQEWIDAKGECGDCMLLLRVKTILNPVLAIAEDETGTVNLFSGNGEDSMIVNFMGDEGLANGDRLNASGGSCYLEMAQRSLGALCHFARSESPKYEILRKAE